MRVGCIVWCRVPQLLAQSLVLFKLAQIGEAILVEVEA